MSRRRHTRLAAPAVAPGIISFRLVEGAGRCLAAEHEHPPLKYRRRNAATRRGQRSALFPAISCGAYGYPIREAAQIALNTTRDFLATEDKIDKVIFVLWSEEDMRVYQRLL